MISTFTNPGQIVYFFSGLLVILLAVFQRPVMRFLRMRPPSELYTLSRLKRSARITERIGRVLVVLLGISFIVQGAGPLFLAPETIYALSVALISLVGLGILATFAVILAHSRS